MSVATQLLNDSIILLQIVILSNISTVTRTKRISRFQMSVNLK